MELCFLLLSIVSEFRRVHALLVFTSNNGERRFCILVLLPLRMFSRLVVIVLSLDR